MINRNKIISKEKNNINDLNIMNDIHNINNMNNLHKINNGDKINTIHNLNNNTLHMNNMNKSKYIIL